MSDHELIPDSRTSVLSDLLVPFRESTPAMFGRHSPSIGLIEQMRGGSGASNLDENTIVPHDRLLPITTQPGSDWQGKENGWEYCGPLAVIGKIPYPEGYRRPTPPIKTDWKEGEDGWEYCGPLAVIGKIPYPEGYRRPTPPIKTDWKEGEDGWEYCGPLAGDSKILYPDGYRPSTAPIKSSHETLPWIRNEPGTARILPWIQGETPGSAGILPWIQGETPGSARILPWIQRESPGSGILPGKLPSAPGRTELLPWIQRESPGSGILPGRLPSAPGRTELLPWHEKPRASSWLKIDPKISEWLDQQACLLSSVEKPE